MKNAPFDHMDFQSRTWAKTQETLEFTLERLRKKNDSAALGAVETAEVRGRIAAVKEILAWPTSKVDQPVTALDSLPGSQA